MRIERENIFLKKTSWLVQAGIVLWAAFLLAALAGCNSKPGSDVMATVDGRKIFRSDVDKYYDNNVASAQQPPTGEQATALRLNILHQMIDDEILMRRAEKLGLLANTTRSRPLSLRKNSISGCRTRKSLSRISSATSAARSRSKRS